MDLIETARLRLEPLRPAHAERLYAIYSERAVRRFLITRPRGRDHFARVFDQALSFGSTHGMWAVIDKSTNELTGRIGFFAFGESARPELAFLLSERWWGKGLATEAAVATVSYGFARREWIEIVAMVRPANTASIRVLTKLGMTAEGPIRVRRVQAVLYRVGRDEFVTRAADCVHR